MNQPRRITLILVLMAAVCCIAFWWKAHQTTTRHSRPVLPDSSANQIHDTPLSAVTNLPSLSGLDGEALARPVCSACHLFPEPNLLDKASWTSGALPEMRPWLGLAPPQIEHSRVGEVVNLTNLFPSSPLLSADEWERIVHYFETSAPESLGVWSAQSSTSLTLTLFHVEVLPYIREQAMVSMVRIDPPRKRYLIGDAMTRTLEALSGSGELEFTVEFSSGPIDVRARPDGLDVLLPGRLFPSDLLKGSYLRLTPGTETMGMVKILDQLRRPTSLEFADLNQDQREDVVVCQFGHRLGRFSWFENLATDEYREHVLLDRPGATIAKVRDFDGDGKPDILVLLAQAWEGVSLFRNLGDDRFEETKLLEKHPLFGYAGLEVMDWNKDGHLDFLTVNGDNGEFAAPVKPYHGLRLYLNDGRGAFQEAWFEPLPGAYQARVRDYDLDGDMDVAAISYFPDYTTAASSGFVYLENDGHGHFARSTFAQSTVGRWICMDAGDIDGDGDEDVVLGSLVQGPTTIPIPSEIADPWKRRSPPVLLLRNRSR